MELIPLVIRILSILTLISGIALVLISASFLYKSFLKKKSDLIDKFHEAIRRNALLLALIAAMAATLGSLFYSEIAGFEPCKLCWYQRIFMYPQVVLLGIALWKKDHKIAHYTIPLSTIGAIIAAYHYFMQFGFFKASCAVVGYSASCAQNFKLHFGYISIPMEALTAFILIIVLAYFWKGN